MSNFNKTPFLENKTHYKGKLSHRKLATSKEERTFFLSVTFDKPIPFESGDSLAIYPHNSAAQVQAFCHALKLTPSPELIYHLTHHVNLSKWTSKMSALLFADAKLPEPLKNLEPIEILHALKTTKEQALAFIDLLPPQLPRYYSIASSPMQSAHKIDLLVSLNSFEADGVLKYGLASFFLCKDAALEAPISCFIHPAPHFRLPEPHAPIIMIGPGTGIAPFRAFIQERVHLEEHDTWLFFGERTRAHDFYFEEELLNYQSHHKLKLSLAFSRDQTDKVYVQDLLLEHKKEVYDWIQKGAHIYICGDAKSMARGVEQAFISILTEAESLTPQEALQKIKAWKKEGRYHLDVY